MFSCVSGLTTQILPLSIRYF